MLADERVDPAGGAPRPSGRHLVRSNRPHEGILYGLDDQHHDHVGLLAGERSDGSPFIEMVPARRRSDDTYEILGTPGIARDALPGTS
jgi:hypothetical protein